MIEKHQQDVSTPFSSSAGPLVQSALKFENREVREVIGTNFPGLWEYVLLYKCSNLIITNFLIGSSLLFEMILCGETSEVTKM